MKQLRRSQAPSPQPNEAFEEGGGGGGGLRPRFWLLVVLTGIAAGAASIALMLLLKEVEHLAWSFRTGSFLAAVERASTGHRILTVALAGLLAGVFQRVMRSRRPGHSGELSAWIWFHAGDLPLVPSLLRAVRTIITVGLGASVGREGALKQAGAALAAWQARHAGLTSAEKRVLAVCGASAGFAAAYNVPLGGALLGLEVLLGTLSLSLVPPILVATIIATALSRLVLYSGATYRVPTFTPSLALLGWAIVAGIVLGVLSAYYVQALTWLAGIKQRVRPSIFFPVLVATALGVASIRWPWLLGNGQDTVAQVLKDQVPTPLLGPLALLKLLAVGLCLGSGIEGGLFTPTLCCGALTAALLAHGWVAIFTEVPIGACVLVSLAAAISGTTHGPIAAAVLVAELTGSSALIVPIALASALAVAVSRRIEPRSIYTSRLNDSPVRVGQQGEVVSTATRFASIARLLALRPRDAEIFVVDDSSRLVGVLDTGCLINLPRDGIPVRSHIAGDLMRPPLLTLPSDLSPDEIQTRIASAPTGRIPVIDPTGRLLDIVGRDAT